MKKKLLIMILSSIILLILIMIGSIIIKMKAQIAKIDETPVDISKVADGTYEGESLTELVKVSVRVTVDKGQITDIEILRHECGKGKPAESMTGLMITQNDVEVDAVSGATVSSEVIKDAIRVALRKGLGQ